MRRGRRCSLGLGCRCSNVTKPFFYPASTTSFLNQHFWSQHRRPCRGKQQRFDAKHSETTNRTRVRTSNRNFFDAPPSVEDGVPAGALRFLDNSILRNAIGRQLICARHAMRMVMIYQDEKDRSNITPARLCVSIIPTQRPSGAPWCFGGDVRQDYMTQQVT